MMAQRRRPTPAMLAAIGCVALIAARMAGWTLPREAGGPVARVSRVVTVARVLDGDTLETTAGERIRLLGVDAPELAHHDQPGDAFGPESATWLTQQLLGQTIVLHIGREPIDRYGRTLAWVYLSDGTLVNEQLIRSGHARLLDRFGLPSDLEPLLRSAQAEAQVRDAGLWK